MTKKSGSSSTTASSGSGLPFVSHEMAARFLTPIRLLGWAILLFTLVEMSSVAIFSLKLKNMASEWAYFTMCADRSWGYVLWGLALALIVPAGPVRKVELLTVRLAHYLCAFSFICCLIMIPIGWTRWSALNKEMVTNFTKERDKTRSLYEQTERNMGNETDLERLMTIAKVAGLQESVKAIANPGELRSELQRRLTLERDNKKDMMQKTWDDSRNNHLMSLVRAMGAISIAILFMGLFWWHSRPARQQLTLPGERKNSSTEYFPYA